MATPTEPLALDEYRALRATIRERGTARLVVAALTLLLWPLMAAWVATAGGSPWLTLLPLIGLWGGFEVVYQLHVGVERVGRYLQVHYESTAASVPAWEQTAMQLGGRPEAATGADPLFVRLFAVAALVNLAPLIPETTVPAGAAAATVQLVAAALLHVAFFLRLSQARRFARTQRRRDHRLFSELHTAAPEDDPRHGPSPPE